MIVAVWATIMYTRTFEPLKFIAVPIKNGKRAKDDSGITH